MIYTTKGLLPNHLVELRESVTHDDEHIQIVRVDKYLKETGEWIGNDLNGRIKTGHEIKLEQQSF